MDGRAVFDFAIRDVAKSIKQTIDESPIEATDLDYLLLHQANDRILDKMARKNRCRSRQASSQYDGIWQYQCSQYPDFTFRVCRTGLIPLDGSQTVLLSGFGGGLTWGTLILTI